MFKTAQIASASLNRLCSTNSVYYGSPVQHASMKASNTESRSEEREGAQSALKGYEERLGLEA